MIVFGDWAGMLWLPWLLVLGGLWNLLGRLRRGRGSGGHIAVTELRETDG
jgi:hypothetical protein